MNSSLVSFHQRTRADPSPFPQFVRNETLFDATCPGLRIGRPLELAFANDGTFFRRFLVARVKLDFVLVALVDFRDADDVLVLGYLEDHDALRVATGDPEVADGRADDLRLVGDKHQLLAGLDREAGGHSAVS